MSCKEKNEWLIEAQEILSRAQGKQAKVNAVNLRSLLAMQKKVHVGISLGINTKKRLTVRMEASLGKGTIWTKMMQ